MRANRIRELWASGKPALNCWITLPGTLAAEMLAHQGWDSLTVDLQHGASDFASMCAMFAAISTTDTVPLMRVAWNTPGDVMRALDAGAYGVICPNIESVEECERFVGACHYPPDGYRSFGPKRGLLYGGKDYVHHANKTILAIIQIETLQGAAECGCHRRGEGAGHAVCRPVRPGPGAGARGQAEPDRSGGDGGDGQDLGGGQEGRAEGRHALHQRRICRAR